MTVPAGQVADFAIDFDACKSFVKAGKSGKILLKPVLAVLPIRHRRRTRGLRPAADAGVVRPVPGTPGVGARHAPVRAPAARSGDPALLSGYIGGGSALATALTAFAFAYAGQNQREHQALLQALREGRVEAQFEND